jgi:hypothetical protein
MSRVHHAGGRAPHARTGVVPLAAACSHRENPAVGQKNERTRIALPVERSRRCPTPDPGGGLIKEK